MKPILLISLILSVSCSTTKTYHHSDLANQKLSPRTGYEGHLTNRICKEKKTLGGECIKWSVKKYDINDPAIRKQLNDFRIACRIGGKRFRVALDRPGFIRTERGKCVNRQKWWGNKCKEWGFKEIYIPVSNYQYLINSAMFCYKGL